MAVYTKVSATELKAHLAHFDIGEALFFEGIKEGVENTNYRMVTPQGGFILTIFEKRVREEDLPFCLSLMEHLHAEGIPCPAIVKTKTRDRVTKLNDKPAVITTFLDGRWPRTIAAPEAAAVGELLAKMHIAANNFRQTRDNPMSLPTWHALIDACGHKMDALGRGMFAVLKRELGWLSQNWPDGMRQGPIHADLFPDNVFFEDDKLTGVIDFYFACTDNYVYDLMLAANAWCFNPNGMLDQTRFTALTGAYKRTHHLTARERGAMLFFGRAAAMRILATRLYDWFHPAQDAVVTPKDPLEYWHILKFYQKAMAA